MIPGARHSISRALAVAALAWIATAARVSAQELRGVVREATTRQPVPGAVLLLLDSAGVSRARNITDQQGSYRIVLSSWMKRMRVLRIGFRPTEVAVPSLSLPTDVAQLDVVMTTLPTMLEPMQVMSGAKCSSRGDRIAALSLLEQARAGLLATVVAQEKRPAEMIRLRTTAFFGDDGGVDHLRVTADSSNRVRRAFQAIRTAADFIKLGFLDTADGSDVLYAPDAETLLDDDFRDGYCFLLRDRDAKRPNAVGLGFAPAKTQRGRIDIDGTLWIDTTARRLLEIRYDYLGLARPLQLAHPGGVVRFHSLDNGVVVIDAWGLRLPAVEVDSSERNVDGRVKKTIVKAQQSGGVVATARWSDGFVWNAPLAVARVKVVDVEGRPQAGRELLLDDTDYRGTSDSSGVVVISRLVPGPYLGFMKDSTLAPIDVVLQTTLKLAIADSQPVSATIIAPSPVDYVEAACKATGRRTVNRTASWFIARVVDSAGKPVGDTDWHAWSRPQPVSARNGGAAPGWQGVDDAGGTTSSDGLLQYCGSALHVGDSVRIEVRLSKKDPWQTAIFELTGPVTAVRLKLMPREKS